MLRAWCGWLVYDPYGWGGVAGGSECSVVWMVENYEEVQWADIVRQYPVDQYDRYIQGGSV